VEQDIKRNAKKLNQNTTKKSLEHLEKKKHFTTAVSQSY